MVSWDLVRFLLASRLALIFTTLLPPHWRTLVTQSCLASSSCGWQATNDRWSAEFEGAMVYVWSLLYHWLCDTLHLYPSVVAVGIYRRPTSIHHCFALDLTGCLLIICPRRTTRPGKSPSTSSVRRTPATRSAIPILTPTSTTADAAMIMTPSIVPQSSYYPCSHSSSCNHDSSA